MVMSCEVVAVGTELLLGQIVDTNSAWIGEQLAAAGIASHHQVKVGDNHGRIVAALRQALGRADAVIVCGGLGPTHDDITREAMAEVMGVELEPDEEVAERIRRLFASRGRRMPDNNLRQALVPVGADVIPQTRGTAPGLICPVGRPGGLPRAGRAPRDAGDAGAGRAARPHAGARAIRPSSSAGSCARGGRARAGWTSGCARSSTAWSRTGGVTLAFLASGWEGIKVRLTARAGVGRGGRGRPGPGRGRGAGASSARSSSARTTRRWSPSCSTCCESVDLTLGLAESVTGGLVAARLTDVPGASDVLRGSIVSYASEVKFDLLGVPPGPVVNEETAMAMAAGRSPGAGRRRRARAHRRRRADRAGRHAGRDAVHRPGRSGRS